MAVKPGPTANRALRKIFGPKWAVEKRGSGGKLHTDYVRDLHCSPDFIWVIKLRRDGQGCSTQRVLVGKNELQTKQTKVTWKKLLDKTEISLSRPNW